MKNAIRKVTVGEYAVLAMSFLTGLAITIVMVISAIMNGIPDLWVGAFMLALVMFGWSPFVGFTLASMHNVDGWSYEGGCYDRWITYRNHDMHIFVSKRPKVRHAYRVAFMADDYDDPFEGHCMTIVYEYDDYGNLHDVLSNAEVFAIDLIIGEIVGGVEI